MDEVDVDAFEFRRKMGPLVHYLLFFVPVILVRPRVVEVCGPFGGEAIVAAGVGDDVFGRDSSIFDLPVTPLDFSLGDVDLEWFDFFRHDPACTLNARKTTWKPAELIRRGNELSMARVTEGIAFTRCASSLASGITDNSVSYRYTTTGSERMSEGVFDTGKILLSQGAVDETAEVFEHLANDAKGIG